MENEKEVMSAEEQALQQVKEQQGVAFFDAFGHLVEESMDLPDYLSELHLLRRLEKLVESRIKQISDDALQEAMNILHSETPARENGAFVHYDKQFEISAKPVFDFVDHAPRYTMPEGVEYRALYQEKMRLSELSKAKTQKMAAITKSFPIEHPDWTPDWTEVIIKCK